MAYLDSAKRTIEIEALGVQQLLKNLDAGFNKVVQAMLDCKGKVVVSGMGKSGLIGQKITATLASTGTPAFFLHPGEALHGDLGMISKEDVALLISYRGETEELLRMLAYLKQEGNTTISITGDLESTLARNADHHLNVSVPKEACPLELAPTASTTATLVLGDALAVALMEARGFKPEDFARFHPAGSLGRKLLTKVADVMRTEELPFVADDITPADLLMRMSEGKLGLAIFGSPEHITGILTDGDFRRGMVKYGGMNKLDIREMMTKSPVVVDANEKVVRVEQLMKEKKITVVLVREAERIVGVYQIFS